MVATHHQRALTATMRAQQRERLRYLAAQRGRVSSPRRGRRRRRTRTRHDREEQ